MRRAKQEIWTSGTVEVPDATECTAASRGLFDHFVGSGEQRWR
jgi:hypothetical protein